MKHHTRDLQAVSGKDVSLLVLMGLWCRDVGRAKLPADLHACLTLASIAFVPTGAALKLYMDLPDELDEISICSYLFIICLGCLIKAALFMMQGSTLRHLVNLLSDTRTRYNRGQSNEAIRRYYLRLTERVHLYMQAAFVPAMSAWILSPMLLSGVFPEAEDHPQHIQRRLPLPLWLPAHIYVSPTYEIVYIIQVLCLTITAESAICTDIFFSRLMVLVTAELKVLSDNISRGSGINVAVEKDQDKKNTTTHEWKDKLSKVVTSSHVISEEDSYQSLVENIRHHQAILRCHSLLQTSMEVSTFILLFTNIVNLCSIMFTSAFLLQKDRDVTKAMKSLLTIPFLLFQTCMYCTFGHMITNQSEKLIDAAFNSGWINCDARFKRSLLIFMLATVNPLEITVGKITKLSKQTIVQVLNGTYGLLNLLYHFFIKA